MLMISKKGLKNYIGRKYILLLRTKIDDLVDLMNELDRLAPDEYVPLGNIHDGFIYDYVIMVKRD